MPPGVAESAAASGAPGPVDTRHARREAAASRRRRRRRWLGIIVALLVLFTPALYSYTSTMLLPSSLPLGVRSVEWLRNHHGNWLVEKPERIYYTWNKPKKGGPQLKALPQVGIAAGVVTRSRAHAATWPPRIKPLFAHPLPGEG